MSAVRGTSAFCAGGIRSNIDLGTGQYSHTELSGFSPDSSLSLPDRSFAFGA